MVENSDPGFQEFIRVEYRTFLWSLYTTLDAFWINPPVTLRLIEHNKLYQIKTAAEAGLNVPDTIIANSPSELAQFARSKDGRVAIKTIHPSVIDSGVARGKFIYTNVVSVEEIEKHRDEIKVAPVFAQEYIEKELELRVTIVGNNVFPCAIYSQSSKRTLHDWRRYDFQNVKHEKYDLPEKIKKALLSLMRKWRLIYGAVDMILTPDGTYVFLEVNPSGQWEWIEVLTGMPISRSIAELLADPPSTE